MRTVLAFAALSAVVGCAARAPAASSSPSPLAWLALGMFASVATALGRRGGDE